MKNIFNFIANLLFRPIVNNSDRKGESNCRDDNFTYIVSLLRKNRLIEDKDNITNIKSLYMQPYTSNNEDACLGVRQQLLNGNYLFNDSGRICNETDNVYWVMIFRDHKEYLLIEIVSWFEMLLDDTVLIIKRFD